VVDLDRGGLRLLDADPGTIDTANPGFAAAVTKDGKSAVYTSSGNGGVTRLMSIPVDGGAAHPLFSLTMPMYSLDTGADGSLYFEQDDRPLEIVRFPPQGGQVERLATIVRPAADYFAGLPDGRAVWLEYVGGHQRLMIGGVGKPPAPFLQSTEEISGPLTAVGADAVAFLVGKQIAVAAVATGRIAGRIPFDKGSVEQLASSPDGKTVYAAAAGSIWGVPVAGGAIRQIHAGNAVAPEADGEHVVVLALQPPNSRLIRVSLNGGPDRELSFSGPLQLGYSVENGGVRNGKLVAPGTTSTWHWPPAIFDLGTGQAARIPLDFVTDFHRLAWTADGKILASGMGWRSSLWKFTPERVR